RPEIYPGNRDMRFNHNRNGTGMTNDTALQDKIDLLRRITLFEKLYDDTASLEKLACLFTTVSCPQGHTVITEGTESRENEALYIIKSGAVEIIKKT
ncbi:MAG: hypothetical protein P8Y16_02825, partial [Sulfurimonas sp.]